jgi:hypothetical protein
MDAFVPMNTESPALKAVYKPNIVTFMSLYFREVVHRGR